MKATKELSDAVSAYKNGDSEKFAQVYELSNRYLYVCIMHIVKNEETAQDMLQETYLEVVRNIHQLKQADDFLKWASMIANRKCFAAIKKNRDVLADAAQSPEEDYFENIADDEEFIPESILQNREKQRLLKEIIDELTEMQRLCIIAYYFNEQKQEEIAEQLGIPLSTVKTNLSRAKVKIKAAVIELDEKKGTRIYSLAPFMLLFFSAEVEACENIPMGTALAEYLSGDTVSGVLSDTSEVPEKAGSDLGNTGSLPGKINSLPLKVKVLIGAVVAAAVIAGVLAIVPSGSQKDVPPAEETQNAQIDETQMVTAEQQGSDIEEPEEVTEEEKEPENTSLEKAFLLSEYEGWSVAFGGVILVKKNELWGAVDYENKVIVPCEYTGVYHEPTSEGYFVLQNETEAGAMRYLFDKQGDIICETEQSVVPTESGYALSNLVLGSGMSGEVTYYNYDGTDIFTVPVTESASVWNLSSYKGKTTVYQFSDNDGQILEQFGTMSEDGTVSWAKPMFEGQEDRYNMSLRRPPVSAANNGYCVVSSPIIEPCAMTMFNDAGDKVAEWHLLMMGLVDGKLAVTDYQEENEYNDYRGYYQDGYFLYNYGSKMVWIIGEKEILVDLSRAPGMTVETLDSNIALAVYDGIYMSDETYWLVKSGEQFGYIDQEGNEKKMYDDASDFVDGKALVITDGVANLIDENFEVVQEIGPADSVAACGSLFTVTTGEEKYLYVIK